MKNSSVPQRQAVNIFWEVFLIKAWLALFLCGVCMHARKLEPDVLIKKKDTELHFYI